MPGVDVIERFYAVQRRFYAGEDVEAQLRELLAPGIEWHVPGRNAIAGHYRGPDAVLDYFARRRALADRTLRIAVVATYGDDERVVQLADGRATVGGAERAWRTVGVYELADERIAACWLLPFDQHAFDEIWSAA